MEFRGQMSKNVHDVEKVSLATTLSVLACLIKFYVLFQDETYVGGPKLVYEHIRVGNIQENNPRDHPRVLRKDTSQVPKLSKLAQPTDGNRHPVG